MKLNCCCVEVLKKSVVGLFAGLLVLLGGCQSPSKKEDTTKLKNMTLQIKDLSDKPVKLVDGVFKGDHLSVYVVDAATANFNDDGLSDGVVVVALNSGGSGMFRILCLVYDNGIEKVQVDQALLGDRIKITNLSVDGDLVTIEYLDRAKGQPLSEKPTIQKIVKYRVQDMKLKKCTT